MSVDSSYRTVLERSREEIKIRGSRFVATIVPVRSRDDANRSIDTVRKEFRDATHNSYAWRLAPAGLEYRFSDDGEPGGTAGKPILFALGKHELVNTLVVVSRYFGGTKLGSGGLARAYGAAAHAAIVAARIVEIHNAQRLRILVPYEAIKSVRPLVEEFALTFTEEFGDVVNFTVDVRFETSRRFAALITDASDGKAGIVPLDAASES